MQESENCNSGYPMISKSGTISSVCGFVSDSNSLKITFRSQGGASTGYRGFRASFTTDHGKILLHFQKCFVCFYYSFSIECGGTFNTTGQGTIASPGYNINGTISYNCRWNFGVGQGSKVNFSVSEQIGTGASMSVSFIVYLK